jgi:hypothetical protein
VAEKMIIYAGEEDDSYITYITPAAYKELAEWMKYREESGEIITGESWVMRDLWDTRVKISKGLVTIPKKLTSIGGSGAACDLQRSMESFCQFVGLQLTHVKKYFFHNRST